MRVITGLSYPNLMTIVMLIITPPLLIIAHLMIVARLIAIPLMIVMTIKTHTPFIRKYSPIVVVI